MHNVKNYVRLLFGKWLSLIPYPEIMSSQRQKTNSTCYDEGNDNRCYETDVHVHSGQNENRQGDPETDSRSSQPVRHQNLQIMKISNLFIIRSSSYIFKLKVLNCLMKCMFGGTV